ncbi:MAG: hypothetical protein WBB31_17670 [Saprospiraceae bacterium]
MSKKILSISIQSILSVFLIFSMVSCGQKSTVLSVKENEAIIDTIRQTLTLYYEDIKKDGLTAEFKYLDHSAEFYWAPPGFNAPISYDQVEKGVIQNAAKFKSVDNSWLSLRIDPLTPELASYTGTIHSIATDTTGQIGDYKLIETGLMIKRNDGWKLFRGQTSVLP